MPKTLQPPVGPVSCEVYKRIVALRCVRKARCKGWRRAACASPSAKRLLVLSPAKTRVLYMELRAHKARCVLRRTQPGLRSFELDSVLYVELRAHKTWCVLRRTHPGLRSFELYSVLCEELRARLSTSSQSTQCNVPRSVAALGRHPRPSPLSSVCRGRSPCRLALVRQHPVFEPRCVYAA